ncbi:MAG: class I SAM-dependent methyltransferase [Acidobacteria bacterium]|nr:class I SAM-dependent methyltransferase [Acidobacteriota bacterium]
MGLKLYDSLAGWWPLLSPPADYEEEAAAYASHLAANGNAPAATLLELGSGGGNNASFLKERFRMTLVDLSPGMLAHSQKLNPECEHHLGDMRTVRLNRMFDRVFIHDAIAYMATLDDLRLAIQTAFVHCRPGGAALFAPDFVRETFRSETSHGGTDGPDRSLRYLEWCWDPDPSDSTYIADYAWVMRQADGSVQVEHDRHVEGLFSRADWIRLLRQTGFDPVPAVFEHSEVDYPLDLFIGVRPPSPD